jgi:hypothetical protein
VGAEGGIGVSWVYIFGERSGRDLKVGRGRNLRNRLGTVQAEQMDDSRYVLLAGVRGTRTNEQAILAYFKDDVRRDRGAHEEYLYPTEAVVEYANWLRSQWFVALEPDEDDVPMEDPSHWLPRPERRIAPPVSDPAQLIQPFEDLTGPLAGTAWAWMVGQRAGIQDYFTPSEIVNAARDAMGGIDLDAASHWMANRAHKIPDWFHTGRSAFENRWYGRVWLNPPYGDNEPWFYEIERYVTSGDIEQLCMISPMWAFHTKIAEPILKLSSGLVLLIPTPKFWGNADPNKTGKNHPHGVLYIGERMTEFRDAFKPFGAAVRFE